MITNERLRRLLDTDREAVIELCGYFAASSKGAFYGLWNDPDFRDLRLAVDRFNNAIPAGFGTQIQRWNEHMAEAAPKSRKRRRKEPKPA